VEIEADAIVGGRPPSSAQKTSASVLNDAIGDLLPSALAVALSPIPIVAIVVVLGAPRARTAGPAFALGWIAGLLSVSVVVVLIVAGGADADSDDPGISWLKLASSAPSCSVTAWLTSGAEWSVELSLLRMPSGGPGEALG
jgi:Sap, sulfolipid-1-addressing protein